MRLVPWVLCLLLASACCTETGPDAGGTGSGSSSGSSGNGWKIVTLDASDGGDDSDLALSVGAFDTVGVAYFLGQPQPAGSDYRPYQIRYVQYVHGNVTPPSLVDTVDLPQYGLGLAIQPSGLPAVAYLGGAPYGGDAGAGSTYWAQSQALVSYQQANGSWVPSIANNAQGNPLAQTADGGSTSYMVMEQPIVLGLFPAIGFDSAGVTYDYFRDVNFGQNNKDYTASNIDGEVGGPGAWNLEWAFAGTTWTFDGTPVYGLGGHNQLAMANGEPALVCDEFESGGGDNGSGTHVDFLLRLGSTPANNWSVPQRIIDAQFTQTGPSIAWDPTFGYAVAVYDTGASQLLFTSSTDGYTWAKADDVYAGAAGWYPSIAISPVTHAPAIADFLCSTVAGVTTLQQCPATQQAVEVRSYSGGAFGPGVAVDPAGGFEPKLGFLSTGKMVIAYRQLPSYDLVLAVQQ